MPWASFPMPPPDPALEEVSEVLDPVLAPLGFAPGQLGSSDGRGQVLFCRGYEFSTDDGCVDLVIDLEAEPEWHITEVRYWGFEADRWQLAFGRDAPLSSQLAELASTLPGQLA